MILRLRSPEVMANLWHDEQKTENVGSALLLLYAFALHTLHHVCVCVGRVRLWDFFVWFFFVLVFVFLISFSIKWIIVVLLICCGLSHRG